MVGQAGRALYLEVLRMGSELVLERHCESGFRLFCMDFPGCAQGDTFVCRASDWLTSTLLKRLDASGPRRGVKEPRAQVIVVRVVPQPAGFA